MSAPAGFEAERRSSPTPCTPTVVSATIVEAVMKASEDFCIPDAPFTPPPDKINLAAMIECCRKLFFPQFYPQQTPVAQILHISSILYEEVYRGFVIEEGPGKSEEHHEKTDKIVRQFIGKDLLDIKRYIYADINTALKFDVAVNHVSEVILAMPTLVVMLHHRVAHALFRMKVPIVVCRQISQIAHGLTSIDIHPGASIDEGFFIDHGTGVVIGATAVIGKNVQLFQGVTLGAKSFPTDPEGNRIKNLPRHPIVEDNVIIYSHATVLGRIRIGKNSVIGGNVWVTKDVAAGSSVMQGKSVVTPKFEDGAGI